MSDSKRIAATASMNARVRSVSALAVVVVLFGSCMNRRSVIPMASDSGAGAWPVPRDARAPFDYERAAVPVSNHDLDPEGPYDVKHLSFPSVGDNGQPDNRISGRYYVGRGTEPRPLVIILPIWGRDGVYPVRKLSKVLRQRFDGSVHVMVLDGPNRIIDPAILAAAPDEETFRDEAARLAGRCRTTLIDLQHLVDWFEDSSDVDQDRIALVGFSIGAIFGADAFLLDRRIDYAVFAMGGTGLGAILASDPHRLSGARTHAMSEFGWSVERYEQEMHEIFGFLDASRLAGRNDPERVLLFEAGRDERIPESSREALWDALGRPERIVLDYRHRNAFLSMTPLGGSYTSDRIYEFLARSLHH